MLQILFQADVKTFIFLLVVLVASSESVLQKPRTSGHVFRGGRSGTPPTGVKVFGGSSAGKHARFSHGITKSRYGHVILPKKGYLSHATTSNRGPSSRPAGGFNQFVRSKTVSVKGFGKPLTTGVQKNRFLKRISKPPRKTVKSLDNRTNQGKIKRVYVPLKTGKIGPVYKGLAKPRIRSYIKKHKPLRLLKGSSKGLGPIRGKVIQTRHGTGRQPSKPVKHRVIGSRAMSGAGLRPGQMAKIGGFRNRNSGSTGGQLFRSSTRSVGGTSMPTIGGPAREQSAMTIAHVVGGPARPGGQMAWSGATKGVSGGGRTAGGQLLGSSVNNGGQLFGGSGNNGGQLFGGSGNNGGQLFGGGTAIAGQLFGGNGNNGDQLFGVNGNNGVQLFGGSGSNGGQPFGGGATIAGQLFGGSGNNGGQLLGGSGNNGGQQFGGSGNNGGQQFGGGGNNDGQLFGTASTQLFDGPSFGGNDMGGFLTGNAGMSNEQISGEVPLAADPLLFGRGTSAAVVSSDSVGQLLGGESLMNRNMPDNTNSMIGQILASSGLVGGQTLNEVGMAVAAPLSGNGGLLNEPSLEIGLIPAGQTGITTEQLGNEGSLVGPVLGTGGLLEGALLGNQGLPGGQIPGVEGLLNTMINTEALGGQLLGDQGLLSPPVPGSAGLNNDQMSAGGGALIPGLNTEGVGIPVGQNIGNPSSLDVQLPRGEGLIGPMTPGGLNPIALQLLGQSNPQDIQLAGNPNPLGGLDAIGGGAPQLMGGTGKNLAETTASAGGQSPGAGGLAGKQTFDVHGLSSALLLGGLEAGGGHRPEREQQGSPQVLGGKGPGAQSASTAH